MYAKNLIIFGTAVLASLIDQSNILSRRQAVTPPLPSLQDCKDHLNVAKDTRLFYSESGGYAVNAREKIRNVVNLKNYKILEMI
jgi:hypothetical protein